MPGSRQGSSVAVRDLWLLGAFQRRNSGRSPDDSPARASAALSGLAGNRLQPIETDQMMNKEAPDTPAGTFLVIGGTGGVTRRRPPTATNLSPHNMLCQKNLCSCTAWI